MTATDETEELIRRRCTVPLKDFFRERREELKLPVRELSEKTGVSTRTIQLWEKGGVQVPRRETVTKLAKGLRVAESLLLPDELWSLMPAERRGLIRHVRTDGDERQWFVPTGSFREADTHLKTSFLLSCKQLAHAGSSLKFDVIGLEGDMTGEFVKDCYRELGESDQGPNAVEVNILLANARAQKDKFIDRIIGVEQVARDKKWPIRVEFKRSPSHTPSVHGTRILSAGEVKHIYFGITSFGVSGDPTSIGSPYWHFDYADASRPWLWDFVERLFDGVWRMLELHEGEVFTWPHRST